MLSYPTIPLRINQEFGMRPEYYSKVHSGLKGHNGIDFYALYGQPIYSACDGIVTFAGMDANEGLGLVIRTKSVPFYKVIYWHLLKFNVIVGTEVKRGDIIGFANSTGLSSGDHLHFGFKPIAQGENEWSWFNTEQSNGYLGAIDPKPFFDGFYACFPKINRTLKFFSIGGEVKQLQALLRDKEFKLTIDGIFGIKTRATVKEFQRNKGIKIDGIVGPITLSNLV